MEVNRDRVVRKLRKLALAADRQKEARWNNFRRYSKMRNVFWIFAGLLAGAAGLLALGDAPKTLTGVAAFAAAFSTALEAKIAPIDRRRRHQLAAAEYDELAWWARHRADSEMSGADLVDELERLRKAMHRLDKEFGPDGVKRRRGSKLLPRWLSRSSDD